MENSYEIIDRRLEKIDHLISIEKYESAEKEIRELIAQTPNVASLHIVLARVLSYKKELTQAAEECYEALKLQPESLEALAILGKIKMDEGQHCTAEKIFIDALHFQPDIPGLYYMYAVLMYKTGYLKKAQALLEISLRLNPEDEDAHSLMSFILAESNNIFGSRKHSHESMKLAPGSEISHYSLGNSYFLSGRPFKARTHFREALRMNPNDKEVEDLFLQADRSTRFIYLPFYYICILLNKIPGKQFTLWGIFIASVYVLPALGVSRNIVSIIAISYLLFVVYTWIVDPLTTLWIKLRPPK